MTLHTELDGEMFPVLTHIGNVGVISMAQLLPVQRLGNDADLHATVQYYANTFTGSLIPTGLH
jgi:hypothetical protein